MPSQARTAAAVLAATMTEDQLQRAVEAAARALGWRVHHETDSRRSRAGLPDLVMVHPRQRRVAFAELKSARGRVTPDQRAWLDDADAAGAETYVWRPADWVAGTVVDVLRNPPTIR